MHAEQGRKAIVAAYWRRRRVSRQDLQIANGISVTEKDVPDIRDIRKTDGYSRGCNGERVYQKVI